MHFLSPVIFVLVDLTLNKTCCIFSSSTELCMMPFLYKQAWLMQCQLNHTFILLLRFGRYFGVPNWKNSCFSVTNLCYDQWKLEIQNFTALLFDLAVDIQGLFSWSKLSNIILTCLFYHQVMVSVEHTLWCFKKPCLDIYCIFPLENARKKAGCYVMCCTTCQAENAAWQNATGTMGSGTELALTSLVVKHCTFC